METFTEPRALVADSRYARQRRAAIAVMEIDTIDGPILDIVKGFQELPYCFTLQSCYGHFIHATQEDPNNVVRLAGSDNAAPVTYRIAYVAFCLENSTSGRCLFDVLRQIPEVAPGCIQFGSADWFWARQVNSYALQVEPERFKDRDQITIDYQEALHIQAVRDALFSELRSLLRRERACL